MSSAPNGAKERGLEGMKEQARAAPSFIHMMEVRHRLVRPTAAADAERVEPHKQQRVDAPAPRASFSDGSRLNPTAMAVAAVAVAVVVSVVAIHGNFTLSAPGSLRLLRWSFTDSGSIPLGDSEAEGPVWTPGQPSLHLSTANEARLWDQVACLSTEELLLLPALDDEPNASHGALSTTPLVWPVMVAGRMAGHRHAIPWVSLGDAADTDHGSTLQDRLHNLSALGFRGTVRPVNASVEDGCWSLALARRGRETGWACRHMLLANGTVLAPRWSTLETRVSLLSAGRVQLHVYDSAQWPRLGTRPSWLGPHGRIALFRLRKSPQQHLHRSQRVQALVREVQLPGTLMVPPGWFWGAIVRSLVQVEVCERQVPAAHALSAALAVPLGTLHLDSSAKWRADGAGFPGYDPAILKQLTLLRSFVSAVAELVLQDPLTSKPKFLKAVASHRWHWWDVGSGGAKASNSPGLKGPHSASRCLKRMPRLSKATLRAVREDAGRVAQHLRVIPSTLARLLLIEYVEQILERMLPAGRAGVADFLTSCF